MGGGRVSTVSRAWQETKMFSRLQPAHTGKRHVYYVCITVTKLPPQEQWTEGNGHGFEEVSAHHWQRATEGFTEEDASVGVSSRDGRLGTRESNQRKDGCNPLKGHP